MVKEDPALRSVPVRWRTNIELLRADADQAQRLAGDAAEDYRRNGTLVSLASLIAAATWAPVIFTETSLKS